MSATPRPFRFVLASAALVLLPAGALLAPVLLALREFARNPGAIVGPAWLGAVGIPTAAALLFVGEWRAIARRDPVATTWIAGFCLVVTFVASIRWMSELRRLAGAWPRGRAPGSWGDLAIDSAILGGAAVAALGHLSWSRALRKVRSNRDGRARGGGADLAGG